MKVRHYFFILLNLSFINSFCQNSKAINKFLTSQGFENASIGICVKDFSGKETISYNEDVSLTPASTLKVITTAVGLEMLGDDYRYETILYLDQNNPQRITVRGYGDPTLGSEYLNTRADSFLDIWVDTLKLVLDKNIPVEIKIDDSYWGYEGVSPKWLYEDLGNYYAAGSYSISVFDNTYKLYFNTMDAGSKSPQILYTEPEMKNLIFTNRLTTNSSGKDNGYINGMPFSNKRILVGDIPGKRKSFSIKGDMPDPGMFLGEAFSERLKKGGIVVNKVTTSRLNYSEFNNVKKVVYTHTSPPLKDIIRVINEKSNNHYTEHLIRTIGSIAKDHSFQPNTLDMGISTVQSFLSQRGLDAQSLFMYDGCGLAPSNKISSELLCDLLLYMQNKSKFTRAFFSSLPKAGQEGTVRNFLKGTRLEGKIFVKSGSIANVQCFTGYYINNDKRYAFAVMVNNYSCTRRNVVKNIETLLLETLP